MRIQRGLCIASLPWLLGVGCAISSVSPTEIESSQEHSEQALSRRQRAVWSYGSFAEYLFGILFSWAVPEHSAEKVDRAMSAGASGGPLPDSGAGDASAPDAGAAAERAQLETLGQRLFEDTSLSASGTQSCASCHDPNKAFTGNNAPDMPELPVARGALPGKLGNRNVPTAMYAQYSPSFRFELEEGGLTAEGGQFWDGRATSLSEQASGPFVNPREMAMTDRAAVVEAVRKADYASMFDELFGADALADVDAAYQHVTDAIAAFERTDRFNPFSSKFDAYLRGEAELSALEAQGFMLFVDERKGNCVSCHVGRQGSRDPHDWLFTDHTYDNLGVPRNPAIADNADPEYYDLGLCAADGLMSKVPASVPDKNSFVQSLCGAFKVPTLRNIALTAPYMHNGRFATLREVVDFYVTRDTDPARWYPTDASGQVHKFDDLPPQYATNVNSEEVPYDRTLGEAPRLSPDEIDAVVAFLQTLSDGYDPSVQP